MRHKLSLEPHKACVQWWSTLTPRSGAWMHGGAVEPGCDILSPQSTEWQIPPVSSIHGVISTFQPVEELSLCSLFAVQQCWVFNPTAHHCTHTGGVHLYTATHTGLHDSPVSRDHSVSHLHFQRSSALRGNIRSLTCIAYCLYFHLKSNRLMFFGEKKGIKCDLTLNSWVIWWLAHNTSTPEWWEQIVPFYLW